MIFRANQNLVFCLSILVCRDLYAAIFCVLPMDCPVACNPHNGNPHNGNLHDRKLHDRKLYNRRQDFGRLSLDNGNFA
jgi:hypothetical protein